jgi:hypothetical protein
MKVYQVPSISPYQRPFWIAGAGTITATLAILGIAEWDPILLPDSARHRIAMIGLLAIVLGILGCTVLGALESEWKHKRRLSVTISENRLIQTRHGVLVELSIDEIKSVLNFRGYLIILGVQPSKRVIVPKAIIGYEDFRRELGGRVTES